jgi:hypothetical protein
MGDPAGRRFAGIRLPKQGSGVRSGVSQAKAGSVAKLKSILGKRGDRALRLDRRCLQFRLDAISRFARSFGHWNRTGTLTDMGNIPLQRKFSL